MRKDYDVNELRAIAKEVSEIVPKNSYALGLGSYDIYGLLGWDAQYHMRDFADLGVANKQNEIINKITKDLANRKDAFVNCDNYSLLSPDFKLIKQFTFFGHNYGYFHKQNII